MSDMFEQAAREKFRFDTSKGQVTVEDLWDLPLSSSSGKASLDEVAKGLHRQLKSDDSISFVTPATKTDETVQKKFDIVKHVIAIRLAENEAAATLRANREKKQNLLALIAQKENEQLAGKSLEDLRAMVDAM